MNKTSYINAVISISIVSFFIALFSLVFLHSNNLSEIVNGELDILIEFSNQCTQENLNEVRDRLSNKIGVNPSTIHYTSKEEALEIMHADLGDDFLLTGMENPFNDILSFSLKSTFYRDSYIDSLKLDLGKLESVNAVFYNEAFDQLIEKNIRKLSIISLIMAFLFGVFAVVIIYNTIKIALMNDKEKIRTMRLVGAKDEFIQKPYLNKMLSVGLRAGLIASVLIGILLFVLFSFSDEFKSFLQVEYILLSIVFALLFSVVISWVSSRLIMNKYLLLKQT